MIIIGVDTGKMTGIFALNVSTGTRVFTKQAIAIEAVAYVDNFLAAGHQPPDVIIAMERYTFTSTKITRQYDALEVIGALKYIAHKRNVAVRLQSRAEKSRVGNDTLRLINLWTPAMGHVNDAARHAFITLAVTNPNHDLVQRTLNRI